MGLCKCPKKKVTNLFCFEHRVNVCEYCLVDNHPNCVVQSYLQWLTDSDYDPNCNLCKNPLTDSGETIRLNCLHVYHWNCFDGWAGRFPPTTAPAGYKCPTCEDCVFPPINQVSPLIEKLREQLKLTNWARSALGLPVLPELNRPVPKHPVQNPAPSPPVQHQEGKPQNVSYTHRSETPATHLDIDEVNYSAGNNEITFERKRNFAPVNHSDTQPLLSNDVDNDSNKYKRRPPTEWLRGLWRAKYGNNSVGEAVSPAKKLLYIVFLVAVTLITIILVLKRLDLGVSESDPMFDPMANPNIRVAEESRF